MGQQRQYVGVDLHRRRSVIVRMTPEGERLDVVRIENDRVALSLEVAKAGPSDHARYTPPDSPVKLATD